jgi:hypothetical protein
LWRSSWIATSARGARHFENSREHDRNSYRGLKSGSRSESLVKEYIDDSSWDYRNDLASSSFCNKGATKVDAVTASVRGSKRENSKSTMNSNTSNNHARRIVHLGHDDKYSWQKRKSAVRLHMEIQARLGRKLRVSYQDFVDEPIPGRFVKLLSELEKRER